MTTIDNFLGKVDAQAVEITIVCECGERLVFPMGLMKDIMQAYIEHNCEDTK